MVLYIENPKVATRKLRDFNEFGKVAGYKINKQKAVAFLCINNKRSERETQETIPFAILSKITKYLGINLSEETKDLYCYKRLIKEIEENKTNGKIYHFYGLEESILSK